MTAQELYRAGRLQEALAAQTEEVKRHAADTERRGFLCELLCLVGELERADRQLDAISQLDTQAALGVSLWRQLIRAEQARQQFHAEGRLPEFLGLPTDVLRLHLEASIHLREGQPAEAARLLAEAEEQRPRVSGTCDGKPFDDWRDLDDLTACLFEVLTSTGKYFWVPVERVESISLHAPVRPRDLLWPRAHLIVRGGPDGEVYLPALYAGAHAETDDQFRLGRATDWRGGDGSPVRGVGLRTFLVGDKDRTILEIREATFEPAQTS
jgi:type VI secretion system protein ImpE